MGQTIVQGSTHGSDVTTLAWCAGLIGWIAVAISLWRGLRDPAARDAALAGHVLTIALIVVRAVAIGDGLLLAVVSAAGAWWGLLGVTGCRVERLLDPPAESSVRLTMTRLAGWLVVTCAVATAGFAVVLPG
jgi:hypothetical protein